MYIPTLKGFAARGTLSGLTAVFIHPIPELSLRSNSGFGPSNVRTNPERVRRERNPIRVDRCLY
jgi:hypothetical protein